MNKSSFCILIWRSNVVISTLFMWWLTRQKPSYARMPIYSIKAYLLGESPHIQYPFIWKKPTCLTKTVILCKYPFFQWKPVQYPFNQWKTTYLAKTFIWDEYMFIWWKPTYTMKAHIWGKCLSIQQNPSTHWKPSNANVCLFGKTYMVRTLICDVHLFSKNPHI